MPLLTTAFEKIYLALIASLALTFDLALPARRLSRARVRLFSARIRRGVCVTVSHVSAGIFSHDGSLDAASSNALQCIDGTR